MSDLFSKIRAAGETAAAKATAMGQKAAATAADLGQKAAATASDLGQQAASKASEVAQKAATTAAELGQQASDLSQQAAAKAAELAQKTTDFPVYETLIEDAFDHVDESKKSRDDILDDILRGHTRLTVATFDSNRDATVATALDIVIQSLMLIRVTNPDLDVQTVMKMAKEKMTPPSA